MAENLSIVYIDMDKTLNQTIVGKSLNSQLEEIHKANIDELKKIEENLNEEELLILSQKNILSNDDYNKKINLFNQKLNDYKKKRQEKIDSVTKKK